MQYLKEKYWKEFQSESAQERGQKFEDLVGRLLNNGIEKIPTEDDDVWIATKQSHDLSRDFVKCVQGRTHWAECKYYKDPISRHTISPTLDMASLEKVESLAFFAPLINKPCLEHLARVQFNRDIPIQAFHGNVLESLILSSPEIIDTFFPDFTQDKGEKHLDIECDERPISISYRLFEDFTDDELQFNSEGLNETDIFGIDEDSYVESESVKQVVIGFGEWFLVEVILHNKSATKRIEGYVRCGWRENKKAFSPSVIPLTSTSPSLSSTVSGKYYLLNSEKKYIEPASFLRHSFIFRTVRPIENLVPYVDFLEEEYENEIYAPAHYGIATSLRINIPILVGQEQTSFIDNFRKHATPKRNTFICAITGFGGVGKTRILEELKPRIKESGRHVHTIYGQEEYSKTYAQFLEELFRKIIPHSIRENPSRLLETPNNLNFWSHENIKQLNEICSCSASFEKNALYVELFFKVIAILRKSRAFFIDNLQSFNEECCSFFDEIINKQYSIEVAPIFALVVNEEVAGPHSIFRTLVNRIKGNTGTGLYSHYKVQELNENEFEEILNQFFDLKKCENNQFTDRYASLSQDIKKNMLARPLYIVQLLNHLLYDKKILSWGEDGYLIINDNDQLGEIISNNYLSKNIHDILLKRWDVIDATFTPQARIEFQRLMLLGAIHARDIDQARISFDHLTDWEMRGLVRFENQQYKFYHNLLSGYFEDWFRDKASRHLLDPTVFDTFKTDQWSALSGDYQIANLIAIYYAGGWTDEHLEQINSILSRNGHQHGLKCLIDCLITELKERVSKEKPKAFFISLWQHAAERLRHDDKNYQIGIDLYLRGCDLFERYATIKDLQFQFLSYVTAAANAHFTGHDDSGARKLLEKYHNLALSLSPKLPEEHYYLSFYFNRLCVAEKSLNDLDKSRKTGRHALKLAQKCSGSQKAERLLFSYIDLANTYQNGSEIGDPINLLQKGKEDLSKAVFFWRKALKVFENHIELEQSSKDYPAMVYLYEAQSLMLDQKYEEALKLVDDFIVFCKTNNRAFFGVKHLMLKGIIGLLSPGVLTKNRMLDVCQQTVIWAHKHHVERYKWMAHYLYAKTYMAFDNFEQAKVEYAEALSSLAEAATSTYVEEYYYHFFDDLVLTDCYHHWGFQELIETKIKSQRIRERYAHVSSLRDEDFNNLLKNYKATSRFKFSADNPYFSGGGNLPTP